MRDRIVAALLVLGCASFVLAGAQTTSQPADPIHGWEGVVLLAPGTPVSVQTGRVWHHCTFATADDAWLECVRGPAPGPYRYRRVDVKRVRFEARGASTLTGGLIGLGAGLGVGALSGGGSGGYTRGGSELFGGMLGALAGSVIGHTVPLVHGRVIYERPAAAPQP